MLSQSSCESHPKGRRITQDILKSGSLLRYIKLIMAKESDQNVFSSPWDNSDIVLVVQDQELHVHKWILTSQSPVFKAMLDGHFKEASQDKVILKDKDSGSMIQFLKMLYPASMFGDVKVPLDDENQLSILALAEEYQCVNLTRSCLEDIQMTPENVMQILPYVVKYNQAMLPEVFKITNCSVPAETLEKALPHSQNKEASSFLKLLLSKCRFMEASIVEMQDAMISLMSDFSKQKAMSSNSKIGTKTRLHSRCPHTIDIWGINKTKSCVHCKEDYKEKFLFPIPSCQNTQTFFNMLKKGDDVATAVKKLSAPI